MADAYGHGMTSTGGGRSGEPFPRSDDERALDRDALPGLGTAGRDLQQTDKVRSVDRPPYDEPGWREK